MGETGQELRINTDRCQLSTSLTRRTILGGGLGAIGLGLLPAEKAVANRQAHSKPTVLPGIAQTPIAGLDFVAVYPLPGSRTASPKTEITFRGASADQLGFVSVVGSLSGAHSGILIPHDDGLGASFVPDAPFRAKETVTVQAQTPLSADGAESITFDVALPVSPAKLDSPTSADNAKWESRSFRSRPDLTPPPIEISNSEPGTAPGLIFADPRAADGQTGPIIFDDDGEPIWFQPMTGAAKQTLDFRAQKYRGQPVLTWWEGVSALGQGLGHFVMLDSSYHEVGAVRVGNGYAGADLHEFKITPEGTALICVYNRVRWDTTAVGGEEDDFITDGIVQEIEISSSRVLFEWHSLDHVDLNETYAEVPQGANEDFDFFHVNSIELDGDGNFIISARSTWTVYKIDRWTGEILWRLGGKRSSFEAREGAEFAYQHDARVHEGGRLSIFDNGDIALDGAASRGIVLDLDTDAVTATLEQEFIHPSKILSVFGGDLQLLPNANAFIGWAAVPAFTEFNSDGAVLLNGRFPEGIVTYRTYRFPWIGQPSDLPAIAAEIGSGNEVTVYASWNGATEVVIWRVLAGPDSDQLTEVGSAARKGFETAITVQTNERYVAVQAEDRAENVLGVSEAIMASPP
jgi:Arylsulfotransferase (ASST)